MDSMLLRLRNSTSLPSTCRLVASPGEACPRCARPPPHAYSTVTQKPSNFYYIVAGSARVMGDLQLTITVSSILGDSLGSSYTHTPVPGSLMGFPQNRREILYIPLNIYSPAYNDNVEGERVPKIYTFQQYSVRSNKLASKQHRQWRRHSDCVSGRTQKFSLGVSDIPQSWSTL